MPAPGSTLIPALRYRDAHAAIDFLCRAFGLTRHAVYERTDGTVEHAELTSSSPAGRGMLMLGTADNTTAYGRRLALVGEDGAKPTATLYLVVADAEGTFRTAQAGGATIVTPVAERSYGGKAFSCHDTEGNLWSIGEYDPWAAGT